MKTDAFALRHIGPRENDLEQIASTIKFDILENPALDFIVKSGVRLQSEISVGPTWGNQFELKTEE